MMGRTWEEWITAMQRISEAAGDGAVLIFVHNLSYEFSFIRGLFHFAAEDVLILKPRVPLYAKTDNIEFRCSAKLTDRPLEKFLKDMEVEHQKLSGDEYSYSKIRYPWTPLTEYELEYAQNDVLGLYEGLKTMMEHDGDRLNTLPLTSTGYVRRMARQAINSDWRLTRNESLPTYEVSCLLREAFRGGDTHANRYFVGDHIRGTIHSYDRSSSYPDVLVHCKYPVKPFKPVYRATIEDVLENINAGYSVIFRCCLLPAPGHDRIELKDKYWGDPYIPKDKCRSIVDGRYDNGRVLSAKYLEISLTEVDYTIINETYEFTAEIPKSDEVENVYIAKKGYLSTAFRNLIIELYKAKTGLKGIPSKRFEYDASKRRINAFYGMAAQNPLKEILYYMEDAPDDMLYISDEYQKTAQEVEEIRRYEHDKFQERAVLSYAVGVYCTAYARYRLYEGIKLVHSQQLGQGFVYCDTDSVKYIGDVDWTKFNNARIRDCKRTHAFAEDIKGNIHYMGVFEKEKDMSEFKTLGAKKYLYKDSEGLHMTLAGVTKDDDDQLRDGAHELQRIANERSVISRLSGDDGVIDPFDLFDNPELGEDGVTFYDSGGLMAEYNDEASHYEMIDGHKIMITPSVSLLPSSYTIGITGEFKSLVKFCQLMKMGIANQIDM